MLRGATQEEKTNEEEKGDDLEESIVLEILREGRGKRDEKGERDEWNQHVGWHRKEDVGLDQNSRHPSEHKTNKKANDQQAPVAVDPERNRRNNQYAKDEAMVIQSNAGSVTNDILRGREKDVNRHTRPPSLPIINSWYGHARDGLGRDYGTRTSLVSGMSSPVLVWAIVIFATLSVGVAVVWWTLRRHPRRFRSFRKRSTKERAL